MKKRIFFRGMAVARGAFVKELSPHPKKRREKNIFSTRVDGGDCTHAHARRK